jgi:NAD(P)H-dependent FMN reductase
MTTIIGISGSLRRDSWNTLLLQEAQRLAPSSVKVVIESIRDIPLYDGDVEQESGLPASVVRLKEAIAAADGLLIVSPEYNASMPGVLKNAIDWLSRPGKDIPRVFGKKPLGLMGASNGRGGTRNSQAAWWPVFCALMVDPWFGQRLFVDSAQNSYDPTTRTLVNDELKALITKYMAGFSEFVRSRPK